MLQVLPRLLPYAVLKAEGTRDSCSRILRELGHAAILTFEGNPVAWCNCIYTESTFLLRFHKHRQSVSSRHRLLCSHFIFLFSSSFFAISSSAYSICKVSSWTVTTVPSVDKRKRSWIRNLILSRTDFREIQWLIYKINCTYTYFTIYSISRVQLEIYFSSLFIINRVISYNSFQYNFKWLSF